MTETRAALAHVEAWIFDLDNTLYPAHLSLWQQMDERIKSYVAKLLNCSAEEAFRIQKDYYQRYGTSLRGLMIEHGMEPAAFLAHVHDVDLSGLDNLAAFDKRMAADPGVQAAMRDEGLI